MRIPALPAILAVITTLSLSASAHAQLLFSTSGTPDYGTGEYADAGDPAQGITENMSGDVFTPTVSGTATNISFNGTYYNEPVQNDNFTISLYSVSGGAPSSLLTTSTLAVTRTVDPSDSAYYNYTGTLGTPLNLNAGTSYYLGITNATGPDYGDWLFSLNSNTDAIEYSYNTATSSFEPDSFAPTDTQVLFSLTEVPEPSSWMMLAGGLGMFALLRLRKCWNAATAK